MSPTIAHPEESASVFSSRKSSLANSHFSEEPSMELTPISSHSEDEGVDTFKPEIHHRRTQRRLSIEEMMAERVKNFEKAKRDLLAMSQRSQSRGLGEWKR